MMQIEKQHSGFALLITLLLVSVVVAVTLSILELSLKQLDLSVDARDSEIAFHAANAGLECVQRTRRLQASGFEDGDPVTFNCFELNTLVSDDASEVHINSGAANGEVRRYQADIEWGTGTNERCSEIDIIVVYAETGQVTIGGSGSDSLLTIIPNYGANTKRCNMGEQCTVAAVSGYSADCSQKTNPGTLEREILLEF